MRVCPKRALMALAVFAGSAAAMLMLESVLISLELLPDDIGKVYIIFALVLSSAVSASLTASGLSSGKAIASAISAAEAEALLLTSGLIISGGNLSGAAVIYQLLCVLAGSITGCLMSASRGHTASKR